MSESVEQSNTVGVIAERLGCPVHRIEYLIRSRNIRPRSWAGHARVFTEEAVQQIEAELQRLNRAKETDHGA